MPRTASGTGTSVRSSGLIVLLRAVNVGGRSLLMTDLKTAIERLGYCDARTLLQSGNAVFRSPAAGPPARIERRLEDELQSRLALTSTVFVRTAAEWADIIAANPFRREAETDPAHLVFMALKAAPAEDAVERLRSSIQGREMVHAADRGLYLVYPDGLGRSKLSNAVIERKLGASGTARNWNTVLKLHALVSSL